jgi:hypothetical protein
MKVLPRPYQDEQDLEKMRALLVAGRKAKTATYYVHVGDLNWWLFYLNQHDQRQATIFLWQADQTIVGWMRMSRTTVASCNPLPIQRDLT